MAKAVSTILDRAPAVPLFNNLSVDIVSKRLGNYEPAVRGSADAVLDQVATGLAA